MMREEAILHKVKISRVSEQAYFQIKLPADAKRIVGIETGCIRANTNVTGHVPLNFAFFAVGDPDPMPELFRIERGEPIGRLTLSVLGSAGIFYQEDIRHQDFNWKYADFSTLLDPHYDYTYRGLRTETNVSVESCLPIVEGLYKDAWGLADSLDIEYTLSLILWIEKILP